MRFLTGLILFGVFLSSSGSVIAGGKQAMIAELYGYMPAPSQSGKSIGRPGVVNAKLPVTQAKTASLSDNSGEVGITPTKSGATTANNQPAPSSSGTTIPRSGLGVGAVPSNIVKYRFGVNGGYKPIRGTLLLLNDPAIIGPAPTSITYTLDAVVPAASLFGGGRQLDMNTYANLAVLTTTQEAMVSMRSGFVSELAAEATNSMIDTQNNWAYSSSGGGMIDQVMLLLGFTIPQIRCALFGKCGIPPIVYATMAGLNRTLNTTLSPTPYSVMSLAGKPFFSGFSNGLTPNSMFGTMTGIASDGTQLYITDKTNALIRTVASETLTTVTCDPGISTILNRDVGVLASTAAGNLTTTANGTGGFSLTPPSAMTDGVGRAASFIAVNGIVATPQALFVIDGTTIRRIDLASRTVKTISGSLGKSGYIDGSPAELGEMGGIATDGTDLYVSDITHNVIRRISISTGAANTLAGISSYYGAGNYVDGAASAAQFNNPTGIATDGVSVFVADTGSNVIRKIDIASGVVSTLAGIPRTSGATDGTSAVATFSTLRGLAIEADRLFVADGDRIRRISLKDGSVTTIAGSSAGFNDGIGVAAQFSSPTAIVSDGKDLYVTDNTYTVRVIIDGAQ